MGYVFATDVTLNEEGSIDGGSATTKKYSALAPVMTDMPIK